MARAPADRRPGKALRDLADAISRGARAAGDGARELTRDRTTGSVIGRDVGAYAARGGRVPQESGLNVRGTTVSPERRAQEERTRLRRAQGDMYKKGGPVRKPAKSKARKRQRP